MDKKQLEDQYRELAKLIVNGDKLIDRLERVSRKEGIKHKTLDGLSYIQGLKAQTDKMIKTTTKLSLTRAKNAYQDFLNQASLHVDIEKKTTKSPTFNFSYEKEGLIQHFANDLNIRMANVDIDNLIKDLKRVKNSLVLKLRKIERQQKQAEIDEQFEAIKKQIENL